MFDVAFRFCFLLTLLRWVFRGCSKIRGGKKATLPKICHINDTVIPYLRKMRKLYESQDILLEVW